MADLPAAERVRLEKFQQWAADVFQDLLPGAIGRIQIVDGYVTGFQGAAGDRRFPSTFRVHPVQVNTPTATCDNIKAAEPGAICEATVLPDGTPVTVFTAPTTSTDTMGASALFHYGGSDVQLDIGPDDAPEASAPVSTDELLAIVTHARFIELVKCADADPVLKKQGTIAAGQPHNPPNPQTG